MKRIALLFAAATLLGSLSIPASAGDSEMIEGNIHSVGSAILWYVPNRINDLADVVDLSVGFGPGFGLGLRASRNIAAEYTCASTLRFGWKQGGVVPQVWDNEDHSQGAALGPLKCGSEIEHPHCDVGGDIHLGLIGVDANIDIYEVVDLAAGLFLCDISSDDDGPVLHSGEKPQ